MSEIVRQPVCNRHHHTTTLPACPAVRSTAEEHPAADDTAADAPDDARERHNLAETGEADGAAVGLVASVAGAAHEAHAREDQLRDAAAALARGVLGSDAPTINVVARERHRWRLQQWLVQLDVDANMRRHG